MKGHQGNTDDQWQTLGTERRESTNHEKGTDPQRKHKESQTDGNPGDQDNFGEDSANQVAWDQMWLEGYEAARKVTRNFFQKLHTMQEAQGETGRIWKQFLHELDDKESASDREGAGKGGSMNAGLQEM
eukprot:6683019-Heterocapsa_arctica.AAC.1